MFCKKYRLRPATVLKKGLWHRCFPVNFAKFLRAPFIQNISGRLHLITFHWFVPSTFRKRTPWKGHFFSKLAGCIAPNLLFHYCMFSCNVSQHWLIAVYNFSKKLDLVPLSWFWIRLYICIEGFAHRQVLMLFYCVLATGYRLKHLQKGPRKELSFLWSFHRGYTTKRLQCKSIHYFHYKWKIGIINLQLWPEKG